MAKREDNNVQREVTDQDYFSGSSLLANFEAHLKVLRTEQKFVFI